MHHKINRLNYWTISVCLIAIVLITTFACTAQANNNGSNKPAGTAPGSQSDLIVNVDDLMKDPDHYAGIVRLEGVVSGILPGEQKLTLIDTREYLSCGEITCASLILPIRWSGIMPKPADTVRITGEIKEIDKKLIFVAQAVENISK